MNATTDPVIIQPDATDSAVVLMHGLGADGNDFVPIVPMLEMPNTKFIFPNAPVIPVTINGGMPMRAWFDITSIGTDGDRNLDASADQITAAVQRVHALADAEVDAGVAAEHMVFAGFSQGGVIALLAGLSWNKACAGILALSTYFPEGLLQNPWPQQPPIYMTHGDFDDVIPISMAKQAFGLLKESGLNIEFHNYPMGHEVIPAEIAEFKAWLDSRVGSAE